MTKLMPCENCKNRDSKECYAKKLKIPHYQVKKCDMQVPIEILPCPFCGGKPKIFRTGYTNGTKKGFIYCTRCKAHTNTVQGGSYLTVETAIAKWNRRAE